MIDIKSWWKKTDFHMHDCLKTSSMIFEPSYSIRDYKLIQRERICGCITLAIAVAVPCLHPLKLLCCTIPQVRYFLWMPHSFQPSVIHIDYTPYHFFFMQQFLCQPMGCNGCITFLPASLVKRYLWNSQKA